MKAAAKMLTACLMLCVVAQIKFSFFSDRPNLDLNLLRVGLIYVVSISEVTFGVTMAVQGTYSPALDDPSSAEYQAIKQQVETEV